MRRPAPPRSPGFMQAELMASVAIFSLAAGSLYVLQDAMLGGGMLCALGSAAANHATASAHALQGRLADVTYIETPSAVAFPSETLTAWSNTAPVPPYNPILPGMPRAFVHFCVDEHERGLFLYQGEWPMPAIACGQDAPIGVERVLVAGSLTEAFRVGVLFRRTHDRSLDVECRLEPPARGRRSSAPLTIRLGVNTR